MHTVRKYLPLAPVFVLLLAWVGLIEFVRTAIPVHATEVTGVSTTAMLTAATVTNTAGTVIGPGYMPRCRESAIYISWTTAVTAGVVTIETSYDPAYIGTWAPLGVVTFAGTAPKQDVVQITGIHGAVRSRLSTGTTGGSGVSSWMLCN